MALSPFKQRLIAAAWTEHLLWTNGAQRYAETDPAVTERMQAYWRAVGHNYSAATIQDRTVHVGPDRWMYWSAAFICYLFQTAGAGAQWTYAVSHIAYLRAAKANWLRDGTLYPFQAYPVRMLPIEPGDVLVNSRGAALTWNGIAGRGHRTLHGDLCVDVSGNQATMMGGNVRDNSGSARGITVNTRTRPLDVGQRVTLATAVALIKNYK
jgi:hypothetical protein